MNNDKQDPGVAVVAKLFDTMMIDEGWAQKSERGFTWWSYRLAQHVEASPPFAMPDGTIASRLRVWTDMIGDVPEGSGVHASVSLANSRQTLSAFVLDPRDKTLTAQCSAVFSADNLDWMPLLATAAVMQNVLAHGSAQRLAKILGGRPAASEHPTRGERPGADALLSEGPPGGQDESRFAGDLMRKLARCAEGLPFVVMGNGDVNGYIAEVPYSSNVSAAEAAATGASAAGTALVTMGTVERHPDFGSGALVTLKLPVTVEAPEKWACVLNLNEAAQGREIPQLGAWCLDPSGDLGFITFVPSILAQEGVLENMLVHAAMRARRAHAVLGERATPKAPRKKRSTRSATVGGTETPARRKASIRKAAVRKREV